MDTNQLGLWRKAERARLVASRVALDKAQLTLLQHAIDAHLERGFPGLAQSLVALCWPYRNEYDARHLARRLREKGARTALPVVVAPRQALIFRLWQPGDRLEKGAYDIPYPAGGDAVIPDVILVPMNGFDSHGFRLGYGGGYFDRTLAVLRGGNSVRPVAIGVAYEMARMATIHPQPYDIAMDYVVTERGVYRSDTSGLEFLEAPCVVMAAAYRSPACFAHEVDSAPARDDHHGSG